MVIVTTDELLNLADQATHAVGILAWYDCRIFNGKVKGINKKNEMMNRTAYGFRDERTTSEDYFRYKTAESLEISDDPYNFK